MIYSALDIYNAYAYDGDNLMQAIKTWIDEERSMQELKYIKIMTLLDGRKKCIAYYHDGDKQSKIFMEDGQAYNNKSLGFILDINPDEENIDLWAC